MSTLTTAIIAAMEAHRRRLIRHFVDASAFSPTSAVPEASLPRAGFRLLARLREDGAILATPDGRLYLDRGRWEALTQARHAKAKTLLALVAVVVFCLLGWVCFKSAT
ncbi:MAG: hypothetical protein EON58_10820 [Alphaproteobacteria bacterium]|nr:MAG: hypothetical protein EON58_10820 [Alphaproteobacteria bacterium]